MAQSTQSSIRDEIVTVIADSVVLVFVPGMEDVGRQALTASTNYLSGIGVLCTLPVWPG